MKIHHLDNKLLISLEFSETFIYKNLETSILKIFSNFYNSNRKYISNDYVIFNIYFIIEDEIYNKILIYPYIEQDISFKEIHNI